MEVHPQEECEFKITGSRCNKNTGPGGTLDGSRNLCVKEQVKDIDGRSPKSKIGWITSWEIPFLHTDYRDA